MRKRDARELRDTVDEHRAGSAVPFVAADLRPGQAETADNGGERLPDGSLERVGFPVEAKLH
jgi:hypothetical protein